MSCNLTLCTLCDKVNVSPESWWCCLRARRPRARRDPDARKTVVAADRDPRIGTVMIFPYPTTSQGNKQLIEHDDVHEIDFSLFNQGGRYILSAGPNLRIFDREHKDVLGHDLAETDLPDGIKLFVQESVDKTLNGYYVNKITLWNSRSWHFHTHPIFNYNNGEAVGALVVTEPYNKPIVLQTSASFVVGTGTPGPPQTEAGPSSEQPR